MDIFWIGYIMFQLLIGLLYLKLNRVCKEEKNKKENEMRILCRKK